MSVKLENCTFTYMAGTAFEQTAVQNVSLELETGELVALVGHTGSGKSTLVQLMNGLLHPDQGRVLVDEIDLQGKTGEAKTAARRVGMVFQYPEHQLFAETVYEDIAFGPRNMGMTGDETDAAVRFALEFVGLDFESFKYRNPLQLSGGQMRRVAIAGVVAMRPKYLILDEPAAGLDPKGRRQILEQVLDLHRKQKMGIVIVTHSMEEAVRAERLWVMDGGRICFDGEPRKFFLYHREELLQLGLKEPDFYEFYHLLKEKGLSLELPENEQMLVKEIKKAKGWK